MENNSLKDQSNEYLLLLNKKVDLLAVRNVSISYHLSNLLSTQIETKQSNNQNSIQELNTRITNLTNDINENIKKISIELQFFKSIISLLFFNEKDFPDLGREFDSFFEN
jgi:hypothetical protein